MRIKKWSILAGTALAVVTLTVAVPLTAFAQSEEDTAAVKPVVRDSLAIVAPRLVPVGKQISMSVFQCSDQSLVEGAGVWAVTQDKIEVLKKEAQKIQESNSAAEEKDKAYEAALNLHAFFIGKTDQSGKVWHAFKEQGKYLLVAVKWGYLPDFRPIAVGITPRALVIDAPKKAEVGEKITITVNEKGTGDGVKDAGVWALTREKAEALKAEMANKKNGDADAVQAAVEQSLNVHGIFLGTTNGDGKLHYAFENAGGYLLVAVKRGYLPGLRPIAVGLTPKVLVIDAPSKAKVGEKIIITVNEKGTGNGVKDAGVWALSRTAAESIKQQLSSANKTTNGTALVASIEQTVKAQGIFLGTTNGDGKLHYAFDKAGVYVLVAVKQGYFPGLRPIVIGAAPQVSTEKSTTEVKPNTVQRPAQSY